MTNDEWIFLVMSRILDRRFRFIHSIFGIRHLLLLSFTLLQVAETRQHTQKNVEGEKNWRLVKHPLRQALEKCSAHPEKYSDSYPSHGIRCSRKQKARAHQQPSHP